MGTTFVDLGDRRGFWMTDGMLELTLRRLLVHAPEGPLREQWALASSGGWTGCVPHALGEAVATPE